MKKLFSSLAIIIAGFSVASAQNVSKPQLSPRTKCYLQQANQNANRVPDYVYKNINGKPYISALIKVGAEVDQAKLEALGVYIGTKAGNVWTAQIPLTQVTAFTNVPGIAYIAFDAPIFPVMDSARRQTHADSAQLGINLPSGITGKDVVMGIIDAGFDFTHPAFFDTAYNLYRIKRVWTQKTVGMPPAGFAYGNEIADTAAIKAQSFDNNILSHGSHVAGIAAGSGYGSTNNRSLRGMAYESDIVMVGIMPDPGQWVAAGESDIIDGINYIFQYGTSVGKPVVVNLSWGSTLGPHDGSSLFSQACDALTGPGKLFVCAAGNNGQDNVHLQKVFSATNNSVSTFVTFSPALDTYHQFTWVDVWGDTGKTFCINVKLWNTASTAIDSTAIVCLDDNTHSFYLIGTNNDTCFVTITTAISEYNSKPHAFIEFHSKVHDNICLTTTATSGTVNMWEGYVLPPTGYYGALTNGGYPWAVAGDTKMTVSDIGCTKSAITVGAYTSKISFKDISGTTRSYSGTRGKIAPFSSLGPTEDNRIKPDIAAPGFAVASSICSFDPTFDPTGGEYTYVTNEYLSAVTGRTYRYAMLAGTSMASPCASGIIALMLQLKPGLSPDEVKNIINATAITDAATGVLPTAGTTTWGHGKINAYGVVNNMIKKESVKSTGIDPMDCFVYPNPNKGTFTLNYTSKNVEPITIQLSDMNGRVVSEQSWFVQKGANSKEISTLGLSKGIYFTKVSSAKGYSVIKTVVE